MKFVNSFITIALYFLYFIIEHTQSRKFLKIMNITQEEVGLLNIRPNGPVPDDELEEARNEIVTPKDPVALVTFSDTLKDKPVGKFRIWGNHVHMAFPTDVLDNKYVQDIQTNEYNKNKNELLRIEKQKDIIKHSNREFDDNEYKKILDEESEQGTIPKNSYKENLMNLSIEREQEIYNKLVINEQNEIKDKRLNGGIYNPLMSFNMQNARDYNNNGLLVQNLNNYTH